jgi:hypothetical protein
LEAVWAAKSIAYPIDSVAQSNEIIKVVFFPTQDNSSFIVIVLVPVDGGFTTQATLIC